MDVTVMYLQVSVTYHANLCPVCHKVTGQMDTVTAGVHVKINY